VAKEKISVQIEYISGTDISCFDQEFETGKTCDGYRLCLPT